MPDTLTPALEWARRGFRIFPLIAGTKRPLWEGWTQAATTDEATIRSWWSNQYVQHEHNIGVLTTGLTVLDADTKDGKNGIGSYLDLALDCDTLTVRTPSNGFHFYFAGADAANAVELLPGLDVRSANGYVVAPGSQTDRGSYTLEIDSPVATLPEHVCFLLRARRSRSDAVVGVAELDTPAALTAALHFVQATAPAAIEGAGGDATTYAVACRVRDLGVSEDTAYALLLEHYNDRCEPPWDPDELRGKVENAYLYATGTPGQATAAAFMDGIAIEPAPPIVEKPPTEDVLAFGNALPTSALHRRPWVMVGVLQQRSVTTLVAPGGASKSTLILTIAAHLAAGEPFLEFECRQHGKSVIFNAEDDLEEQTKRLRAICSHYKFDFETISSQICLLGPDQIDLQLTTADPQNRFSVVANAEMCQRLGRFCAQPDVVFCGLDPYLEVFGGDINDNPVQKLNMSIARQLARVANVAVMAAHHTRKPAGGAALAGDAASSMGASAIINSARLSLTLVGATSQDCERYAIPDADRTRILRLDSAKGNYVNRSGEPIWLKRSEVQVLCGADGVTEGAPVIYGHDLRENMAGVGLQIARTLDAEMRAGGVSNLPLTEAAARLMQLDPLCEKLTTPQTKVRIENALAHGVPLDGGAKMVVRMIQNRKCVVID